MPNEPPSRADSSRAWTHAEKVEYLIRDLAHHGWQRNAVAPPLFRLLWKLGIEVPPPPFLGYLGHALLIGGFFSVGWYLSMLVWCWYWQLWEVLGPLQLLLIAAVAGPLFGLMMAGPRLRGRPDLKLPPWRGYPPGPDDSCQPIEESK
jgi:hypothetical protein